MTQNILVLSGNTPFHALEKKIEEISQQLKEFSFTLQSLNPCIQKTDNLGLVNFLPDAKFRDYDLVITHAGAGTVFFLIKNSIPFIAVPNLERKDHHQLELFNWIRETRISRTALVSNLDANLLLEGSDLICNTSIDLPDFDFRGLLNELFAEKF